MGAGMKPLIVVVLGCPIPQERARVTRHGAFTPKRSRAYRGVVACLAQSEVIKTWTLEERELIKSKSQKWAVEICLWFPDNRRRDIENCSKAITDAMTKIVYYDDSQIYDLHLIRFVNEKEHPKAVIRVEPIVDPR